MRSAVPKMLYEICGRPMVQWPIRAAIEAGAGRVVVVGGPGGELAGAPPAGAEPAAQREPRGPGDAVLAAAARLEGDAPVLVVTGDTPLVTPQLLAALLEAHTSSAAAATIATVELDDPTGYGRVVRGPDGSVEHIAETKSPGDADEAELQIREVNAGVYAFDGARLLPALKRVQPDNAQGEYYLPDVLQVFRGDDHGVAGFPVDDPQAVLGVNDRVDLARVRALVQPRIHEAPMRAGVTLADPGATTTHP